MKKLILFLLPFLTGTVAWADTHDRGLQVDVERVGSLYTFEASFDTLLTKCGAYRYLTDYQAEKHMPGVVESYAERQSANRVKVERTVDEHILFLDFRLHSVMEYTEKPFDGISFTQLAGDSKSFQGSWDIEPNRQGSTLRFRGLWEPDTVIPFFIIDHFAKNGLVDKFSTIARLADERAENRDIPPAICVD
jgi:hypothetical protein